MYSAEASAEACYSDESGGGMATYWPDEASAQAACSSASGPWGACGGSVQGTPSPPDGYGRSNLGTHEAMYCPQAGANDNRTHLWAWPITQCTATQVYDNELGYCEDDAPPIACQVDEMSFSNEFGEITSCVASIDPDLETCENPQGYINGIEICGDNQNQCQAAGGDFGYLNGEPICVQPEIETAGDYCPSGYVVTYNAGLDGNAGSYNCVLPDDLPPNICDATIYDCDGDGNIDDQNENGCTDNGIADDPMCPNLQPQFPGQNPLQPPVEGAGDCDPTSRNYAECAGFLPELEDARGTRTDLSTGASMDSVAGNVYTRLENAPIVQMIGNVSGVFSFSNAACPTPSFEAFGSIVSIDYHCTLYLEIAGILSVLMMIVFSIGGIRHIASA